MLSGTDALGVKVRGGTTSFEVKLRPRPAETLDLPSGSGRLEEWQKWALPRPGITRFLPRLGLPPRNRWVAVEKQRRMVTVPSRGGSGCRVELTSLEAAGQSWTTLGFEAFGPPDDLRPALYRATEEFFGAVPLPGGGLSCGYPGWLATL